MRNHFKSSGLVESLSSSDQAVSNYFFVDEAKELISFSELPVLWNDESAELEAGDKEIFVHGVADGGLQRVFKQVVAWKFDLSGLNPKISVLSNDRCWIKLENPKKSFIGTIKTILITVRCLHILNEDPQISESTLWDWLSTYFCVYLIRPSEEDLMHHKTLINEAVKRYDVLANSKFFVRFQEEQLIKREALDEEDDGAAAESGFLSDEDMIDETEDGSGEGGELFDSVCAICDNGGDVLCCEGRCLRSFHATVNAGAYSMCESLGLSDNQVEKMQIFICKNCESKQHQCFSCGELGSSDKSLGAEVFACVSATCGHFYHPGCVSKLVQGHNLAEAKQLEKKIAAGEPFTCPVHKCYKCKEGENKMYLDLQFAVCRRCPKSYHRKCLPRNIAFQDMEDEGIIQRAWEGLLPNRILIYCLDHEIDDATKAPPGNHIKFPKLEQKKRKKQTLLRVEKAEPKERSMVHLDDDSKKKISNIMKDVSSSVTREDIIKKQKTPLTHTYSSRNKAVKDITAGEVERAVKAIRAASKKLEEGRCSLKDVTAVCEPKLVEQIFRWQSQFKGYLAPFLYDMSYTSFGRHFTRVEKLKEIANMVHWYIEDGDMVVDFCCGANDFSYLVKKRTDEMGKKCSFKNYDIIRAKNDFNFEVRDWMSVRPKELKPGSQLVIGLHPPVGVTPDLANKFIDKALEFKPKLLILILPQDIERFNKKDKGLKYDLIWKDAELLSGKSFYIPGSVDVNDEQMDQWESNPPPLCLWSHADWTDKHKEIAQKHGHISRLRSDPQSRENGSASAVKAQKHRNVNPLTVYDIPVQHEEQERSPLVRHHGEREPVSLCQRSSRYDPRSFSPPEDSTHNRMKSSGMSQKTI